MRLINIIADAITYNIHAKNYREEQFTLYLGHEEYRELQARFSMHYGMNCEGDLFMGVKFVRVNTTNHLNLAKDTLKAEQKIIYSRV